RNCRNRQVIMEQERIVERETERAPGRLSGAVGKVHVKAVGLDAVDVVEDAVDARDLTRGGPGDRAAGDWVERQDTTVQRLVRRRSDRMLRSEEHTSELQS